MHISQGVFFFILSCASSAFAYPIKAMEMLTFYYYWWYGNHQHAMEWLGKEEKFVEITALNFWNGLIKPMIRDCSWMMAWIFVISIFFTWITEQVIHIMHLLAIIVIAHWHLRSLAHRMCAEVLIWLQLDVSKNWLHNWCA